MTTKIISDNEDMVYVNMSFLNNQAHPQPAQITETRTQSIIKNPSDWLMSVVRFDVDCHSIPINLPLMFVDPITNVKSQTLTKSTIYLTYLGNTYDEDIIFIPNPGPLLPSVTPLEYIPAIYDYQVWFNFVNTALGLAFIASGAVGSPPQFIYNAVTGLVDLYIDQNFIPSAGPNLIYISVNETLYKYFTNFEMNFNIQVYTNEVPYNYAVFRITDTNTTLMPPVGARNGLPLSVQNIINLYKCTQLASGTGSLTSLRSIILTSNLLPFRAEGISTVGPNGANNSYNTTGMFPILSDFLVPAEQKATEFRIVNEYLPTPQYRYINLYGRDPITTIDIKMYWTDFQQNIYPMYLASYESMNVKILFQKKKTLLQN